MNEGLFQIVLGVITVLCAIVTGILIPYIRSKIDSEKLDGLMKWVTYGVQAAELMFQGEKQGVNKKDYVTNLIMNYLSKKKVNITSEQLNVLIESAVAGLKGKV